MIKGKIKLGQYEILPNTLVNVLNKNDFLEVKTKNGSVFISQKPMEFGNALFWMNFYFKNDVIDKVELQNANEKFKMNYHTMNDELVATLKNENENFLKKC